MWCGRISLAKRVELLTEAVKKRGGFSSRPSERSIALGMEYLSRLAAAADAEDAKRDADAAALTAEETSGPSTPLSQPDVSEREEVTPPRSKPSPPVAEPWVDRLELLPNVVSNGGDRISETELGGLTFNADFDSGNVVRVCQRSDAEAAARWKEYNLQGKPAEVFATLPRTRTHGARG